MNYDPMISPNPEEWLQIGEMERINVIENFHRSAEIRVPNEQAHAIIHAIVETQLAMKVEAVSDAMRRLGIEGLDRHESLHAVGTVLAELLRELMNNPSNITQETTNEVYAAALKKLTVAWWRNNYGNRNSRSRNL